MAGQGNELKFEAFTSSQCSVLLQDTFETLYLRNHFMLVCPPCFPTVTTLLHYNILPSASQGDHTQYSLQSL